VDAVHEVFIMGGALRVDGNTTSLAEFNFFVDPHAAHIVLESGMPITLVPWDITKDVLFTQAHVDRLLKIDSPITHFIQEATRFYIEFHLDTFGYAGCSINDPVALALAFMPDLAVTQTMHVAVEFTSELAMGKSVISFIGEAEKPASENDVPAFDTKSWPMRWRRASRPIPNVKTVVKLDNERFVNLFVERMEWLANHV
jgi:purine nucleosidase